MGMLAGLAFLPLDQIVQGMEHLRNVKPPEAQRLTEYFDATYVSGIQRWVNVAGEIRRVPPRFIPALWNVHEETVTGNPRINNTVEGWNNKLRHLVGHQHPTIWKLIKVLQTEQ